MVSEDGRNRESWRRWGKSKESRKMRNEEEWMWKREGTGRWEKGLEVVGKEEREGE